MYCQLGWTILKRFSLNNTYGFTLRDVVKEFPEKTPPYLNRVLSGMVRMGMIGTITRGTYYIVPIEEYPEAYYPSAYQVIKYIMKDKEYYIGYGSALKIHGLTYKTDDKEYVVTKKQFKPSPRNYGGISNYFITHDDARFFGFSSLWINQHERAMVSDLEKTIVDMASKPGVCGGIPELGNVLHKAESRTNNDKLFYYFAKNRIMSAKKRFLFLTHMLGLTWTNQHSRMAQELGSSISLLDPTVADQGRKKMAFGLKINLDPSLIKNNIINQKRF